ncbi:MAG TPA: hypothetical protein VLT16_17880 [Candidatus Limnocylindrales bacterium]|nr:hypothetical protein [Candidatus Limnocylindrales bacterium]
MDNGYTRNRTCACPRCKARGLMGAAILITVGVLFLLDNFNVVDFGASSPAILIVVGVFLYLSRTASTEGHVQQYVMPGPAMTQPPAANWNTGTPAPPPAGQALPEQNNPEVKS